MKITKVAQSGETLKLCFEALGQQGGTIHQIMSILRASKVLAETVYNETNQDQLHADVTNLKYAYHHKY